VVSNAGYGVAGVDEWGDLFLQADYPE